MSRSLLVCVAASAACTLGASPLGVLPGDPSASASMTAAAETTSEPTTSEPTTAAPPTEGSSGTSSTGSSTSSSSSGDDTGEPGSAWEQYCEYINTHGGECAPNVDMFPDLDYPGRGFIVHEWGTDTIVVGSDGSVQRGLHHEEEDLPAFVYDRIGAGALKGTASVHVKMETPVTYFYSDVPRSAKVSVGFPDGVFTQWYPAVADFEPFVAAPGRSPSCSRSTIRCSIRCSCSSRRVPGQVRGHRRWSARLGHHRDPRPRREGRARGRAARRVHLVARPRRRCQPLEVSGVPGAAIPQHERFLFYRGLGNFPLPLTITASAGPVLALANNSEDRGRRLFVMQVDGQRGAFVEWKDGVASGAWARGRRAVAGPGAAAGPVRRGAGRAITEALDATGLYHDKAVAMVATWKRQWFRSARPARAVPGPAAVDRGLDPVDGRARAGVDHPGDDDPQRGHHDGAGGGRRRLPRASSTNPRAHPRAKNSSSTSDASPSRACAGPRPCSATRLMSPSCSRRSCTPTPGSPPASEQRRGYLLALPLGLRRPVA